MNNHKREAAIMHYQILCDAIRQARMWAEGEFGSSWVEHPDIQSLKTKMLETVNYILSIY